MGDNLKQRPLKILCLHGYRQNEATFREKTGGLRKMLKKHAEFVFFDAPHKPNLPSEAASAAGGENGSGVANANAPPPREDPRGWWFSRAEGHFSSRDVTELSDGFDESVERVLEFITVQGPFDGILAFSQGAAFTFLLLAMRKVGAITFSIRFVILVSAFASLSSKHAHLIETTIVDVPSVHIFGINDQVVDPEISRCLAGRFANPGAVCIEHAGGHFIPTLTPYKQTLITFIEKMMLL